MIKVLFKPEELLAKENKYLKMKIKLCETLINSLDMTINRLEEENNAYKILLKNKLCEGEK